MADSKTDYTVHFAEAPPSPEEYARLRAAVGWSALDPESIEVGLHQALYSVTVYSGREVIGCGRVLGDGALYFYLQDVMVAPEVQGQGLGHLIVARLMNYVKKYAKPNAFVGLMAAEGTAGFYEKFNFERRPVDRPGMYRIW